MIDEIQNLGLGICVEMIQRLGAIDAMVVGLGEDGDSVQMGFEGEEPGEYAIAQAVEILRKQHPEIENVLSISYADFPYKDVPARDIVICTAQQGKDVLRKAYRLVREAGAIVDLDFLFSSSVADEKLAA